MTSVFSKDRRHEPEPRTQEGSQTDQRAQHGSRSAECREFRAEESTGSVVRGWELGVGLGGLAALFLPLQVGFVSLSTSQTHSLPSAFIFTGHHLSASIYAQITLPSFTHGYQGCRPCWIKLTIRSLLSYGFFSETLHALQTGGQSFSGGTWEDNV